MQGSRSEWHCPAQRSPAPLAALATAERTRPHESHSRNHHYSVALLRPY